eukprot:m.70193 g.70193  ORF g.70193 m.70193 type:complete len:599 (-) comp24189_c0_seq2:298-2094(-)
MLSGLLFVVATFAVPGPPNPPAAPTPCDSNDNCGDFEFCDTDTDCTTCAECNVLSQCDATRKEFCNLGCVEGFAERSGQCDPLCETADGSHVLLLVDNLCSDGRVCCVTPTTEPTTPPTSAPTTLPTSLPTSIPSHSPSANPTTSTPSFTPTRHPTLTPSTPTPSIVPTHTLTLGPTLNPSSHLTKGSPTQDISTSPTSPPTPTPTSPTTTTNAFSHSTAPTNSSTTPSNTDSARSEIIGGVIAALVVVIIIVVVVVSCNRKSRGPSSKNVNPLVLNNYSLADLVASEDDPNYITVVNDNTTFEIPMEDVEQSAQPFNAVISTTNPSKAFDVDDKLLPSEHSILSRAMSIKSNVDSLGYQIPVVQSRTDGDDDDGAHDYTNLDDTPSLEAVTVSLSEQLGGVPINFTPTITNNKTPMYSAINKERAANLWDNIITRSSVRSPSTRSNRDDVDITTNSTTINPSKASILLTSPQNTGTTNIASDMVGNRPRASTIPDRTSMIDTINTINTTNTTNTTNSDAQRVGEAKHDGQPSVDAQGYEIPVVGVSSSTNNEGGLFEDHDYADAETIPDVVLPPQPPPMSPVTITPSGQQESRDQVV